MPKTSSGSVTIFSPPHNRAEILDALREAVPEIRRQLPLRRLVLFGSQATGRAAVGSDIDVLAVYDGPRRDDAFKVVKRSIDLVGVEPHLFTTDEARTRHDLVDRMSGDGVVLYDADA